MGGSGSKARPPTGWSPPWRWSARMVAPDPVKRMSTSSGDKFRDKAGADGVGLVMAKAGSTGRAKGLFQAGGPNLELPPLGSLPLPINVQLNNATQNLCWGSEFDLPQVDAYDSTQLKAKVP